jgi:hypothetical protein
MPAEPTVPEGEAHADLAKSIDRLVRSGSVSDLHFTRGGPVEFKVSLDPQTLKSTALRQTLASLTDPMM